MSERTPQAILADVQVELRVRCASLITATEQGLLSPQNTVKAITTLRDTITTDLAELQHALYPEEHTDDTDPTNLH